MRDKPSERLELSLERGRTLVAKVVGPSLGDASAPLTDRCRVFGERLRAFRSAVREPMRRPRASTVDVSATCAGCGCRSVANGVCAACGKAKEAAG